MLDSFSLAMSQLPERGMLRILAASLAWTLALFALAWFGAIREIRRLMAGAGDYGTVFAVGGAILLMPALVVLLEAAVAALVESGLAPYWSALAIGGGCFIIGLILLLIGVRWLRAGKFIPDKTINQLQRDAATARSQVRIDDVEKRAA